jgi:hypothetical protein
VTFVLSRPGIRHIFGYPNRRPRRGRLRRGGAGRGGCIAGALSVAEYRQYRQDAGFTDADISLTREVGGGMHSAVVRATKPV